MVWPPTVVSTRPMRRLLDWLQDDSSIAMARTVAASRIGTSYYNVLCFAKSREDEKELVKELTVTSFPLGALQSYRCFKSPAVRLSMTWSSSAPAPVAEP